MLTLRLKPSVEHRLDELALRTGLSKTFHACGAIEEWLNAHESRSLLAPEPSAPRDVETIRRAISDLKTLRKGVSKPPGMSVREMLEEGRA